ncbi:MAG: type II secretion system secretin GspD [Deltaproteobacteria bacterium]|nr:type II secretion system secretin GspD [Deltaproteobacteria bacterium]
MGDKRYIVRAVVFVVVLGLLVFVSPVHGARVAGEEGVTPTTPQANSPAKRPLPAKGQVKGQKGKHSQPRGVAPEKKTPEQKPKQGKRYVSIDFDNVDITLFIKFIAELTGKNFVVDKAVRGNVTIISPTKISVEEAYKVFESVLEVNGYTTVPAGRIIKVVPAAQARSKDVETIKERRPISPRDRVVTQLIPLRYADPNDLKKLLAPLVSKSSIIVSYPPTGMLIVTDVLSNVKRLLEIIEAIDVEGIGEEISVIPLEHASASTVAKTLNSVFQRKVVRGKRPIPGVPTIKIVADERTNSLITLASEDDTRRIKQLVKLLDLETPRVEGDIHVYYLQHANAEDLSKVLMAIPAKQEKPVKGKAPVVSRDVRIVADKATNSLVITAKKEDYKVLEDVIKKLDIARNMVYIEALIMEVDTDKQFDLGVQWQAAETIGSHEGRDIAVFGSQTTAEGLLPLGAGFSFGVLGDVIQIGGIEFPSISAVVKALQTNTDINILSTPQILTTDNEEAEIKVAKEIPFITSREETVSGRAFTNFEYKDVGVVLNITPQINQERYVRLKLTQEVSQVVEEESREGLPTTLKRIAKTTLVVQDGQTVVIGGLIDEILTRGETKVPCLGDITGVGWLFRSMSDRRFKTNLYIFLTPHIIASPMEADDFYEKKKRDMDKIREGAIKMYGSPTRENPEARSQEPEDRSQ